MNAAARHWPEYLMEAAGLGLFLLAACAFGVALEHPSSPLRAALPSPLARRFLMGLAMAGTAVTLVTSPWGQQSGAHFNPAVTLTYYSLGKIGGPDALFYVLAQFGGGAAGVAIASAVLPAVSHPRVHWVATAPGAWGRPAAFGAELLISGLLMFTVLRASNHARWSRWTPLFAGALIAIFITVEAPVSGMSMNPARTLGSAIPARLWDTLWIYFLAPPLGMLAASRLYRARVYCAKLHHHNNKRCIFRCAFGELTQ